MAFYPPLTVDHRNLELQCAYLEDRVYALVNALEQERQRRHDVERALENFVTENRLLHDQLENYEHRHRQTS